MPELPDLYIFSKNLKKIILNRKIISVKIFNNIRLNAPDRDYAEKITGTSITDIIREGKELRFLLENGGSFNVHLMLNGRFSIHDFNDLSYVSSKIMAFCFDGGQALVISDYQALCRISLSAPEPAVPDAMSEDFTFDYFVFSINKNRRKNIKALIIDQNIVRGIGNAYADEILYEAGISPESLSGKIPGNILKDLYDAIGQVLRGAIASIEKILPDAINKEERSFLKVHNPDKIHTEKGEKITVKKIASKTTYYTENQTLFK